ncbi:MAG: hypothetical protein WDN27_05810 [Candidatus Saccharibacteria bacterium]
MKLPRDQKGFATVELILVVIVLVIVGFTGWFVWHSTQAANRDYSANPSSGTSSKSSTVKTFAECKAAAGSIMQETYPEVCVTKSGQRFTDTLESAQGPGYLVITEWSVKFQIPTGLKTMKYTVANTAGNAVWLDSGDLSTLAGSTKYCGDDPGYLGVIERVTEPTEHLDEVLIKKVGAYYYYYGGPQQACLPESSAGQASSTPKDYPSAALQTQAASDMPNELSSTLVSL